VLVLLLLPAVVFATVLVGSRFREGDAPTLENELNFRSEKSFREKVDEFALFMGVLCVANCVALFQLEFCENVVGC